MLPRLAALQTATTAELKQQWRALFGKEPPPVNRPYLVSRLAYEGEARGHAQARVWFWKSSAMKQLP